MSYIKNTWKTDDIITADKLNNMEDGILGQYSKPATFTDFNTVASGMTTYQGFWHVGGTGIANGPNGTTTRSIVEVISANDTGTGLIRVTPFSSSTVYVTSVDNGTISGWVELSNTNNVLQLTGDQTVSGNKSFTGNVSISGSVMNYATIPSISITGYVSGSLYVSKQSGMVSITSNDLVVTKGAKFTLPAGYLPRNKLQAPVTGRNYSLVTAAGYLTVDANGLVTFNSIGFASGNATVIVNANYIAKV
ncbi:baseplate protein [Leuconostoc phage Ln-7]|uniref:Baseplate protein n=1 Tax=Leuconostoc phage Ln-7 TaxID=1897736 RepID=A0A219VHH6_9CAUD|nr:baseplate protein [Leuconostoc phage Ln-7]AOT27910.1 baseplate protein [Leuconostoc phage Ln-7]